MAHLWNADCSTHANLSKSKCTWKWDLCDKAKICQHFPVHIFIHYISAKCVIQQYVSLFHTMCALEKLFSTEVCSFRPHNSCASSDLHLISAIFTYWQTHSISCPWKPYSRLTFGSFSSSSFPFTFCISLPSNLGSLSLFLASTITESCFFFFFFFYENGNLQEFFLGATLKNQGRTSS